MTNKKLSLPQVTLIAVSSVKIYETIKALQYSMQDIEFGEVILVTHKKPRNLPKGIVFKQCEEITEINKFNYMMVYELDQYVNTDYMLLVHYDGFVVNPLAWKDEFLDYDYIGSPWPLPSEGHTSYYDSNGEIIRVGNSVSLRSKRLLEFPRKHNIKWRPTPDGDYNEDIFLCCMCKNEMESEGLKFATIDIAKYFGREHTLPENKDIDPFIFHKWWGENEKYPKFVDPKYRVYKFLTDISRPLRNKLGIHKSK